MRWVRILEHESDAGERLAAVASALRSGDNRTVVTVRSFLQWFGAQRRGYLVVKEIREALARAGLRTEPDFESAYIDGQISFALETAAPERDIPVPDTTLDATEQIGVSDHVEVGVVSAAFADPTHRMSKLAASNRTPVSIAPDATLGQAVTVMMANDFSQLPVMPNDRDVRGVVSWRSIGSHLALGLQPTAVRDVMDTQAEIRSDASLFAAIPLIVEHGYVLVRGFDQRIAGIVTTSDLSLQFQQLAEPFLLLDEIENHIRRIIGSNFSTPELQRARDPDDDTREVETVADLSFGEYRRILEQPNNWDRLNLRVDRAMFVGLLDRVREIRNDVMHFDPDGIPNDDLNALRDFTRFLQTLQTIGVT